MVSTSVQKLGGNEAMSYLGIGYTGDRKSFLRDMVNDHAEWLRGDRVPRFFGDAFLVMYDSNTAREFAKKCRDADDENAVVIYPIGRPVK